MFKVEHCFESCHFFPTILFYFKAYKNDYIPKAGSGINKTQLYKHKKKKIELN